jgi:hypothetical protein
MMIGGREAAAKARPTAEAILTRVRRMLTAAGLADFRRTSIEVLGAEDTYGPHARAGGTREVILKVAVHHDARDGCELFSREFLPSATSMAQGITGFSGGRPSVTPLVRLFSCLVDKADVPVTVATGGTETPIALRIEGPAVPPPAPAADAAEGMVPTAPMASVPLIALAYGRSGDKGDDANIGVISRRPEFVPVLRAALTAEAVKAHLAHLVAGQVERYELPGINGFNFLLHQALGGGGVASLRHDPQGKAFAQMLMDLPIALPEAWLQPGGLLAGAERIAAA